MAKNKKIRASGGGGGVDSVALDQEILLRQEGDSYLQSQIDSLSNGGSTAGLEDEINARIAGDLNLQNQLTNTTNTANQAASDIEAIVIQLDTNTQDIAAQEIIITDIQADTLQNSQNLTTEIGNRIGGDSVLQAQIDAISLNFPDTSALTALITAETNARIGADTSLQNQINAQNLSILNVQSTLTSNSNAISSQGATLLSHTNQLSTIQTSVDTAVQNVSTMSAQLVGIQTTVDLSTEAIIELQDAFENLAGANDIVIECTPDVLASMLVYIDQDGVAQPARSDSVATMPAKFVVTSKLTATTCAVKKEYVAAALDNSLTGKAFFVSETEAGGIQLAVPTTAGAVMQTVGEGLFGNKKHYSISDRITVRS